MRLFTAFLLLALPSVAQAKVEIRDIQASHGPMGPERKSTEYVHGDEVFFRFTVVGFQTEADGWMRTEMRLTVTDAKGRVVTKGEFPLEGEVGLGGDSLPASARFTLDEKCPPGEYELTVEFIDRIAKESASFKRKVTCKPVEFALLEIRFYHNREETVPARVGGTVRQLLVVTCDVVGFDRSKNEIDLVWEIEILDPKGKPARPKSIVIPYHNEKPKEVKERDRLPFSGYLTLNRPGDFTLRLTVTDKMTKKKLSFEAPLHVTAQ